jgi:hypothetical protein
MFVLTKLSAKRILSMTHYVLKISQHSSPMLSQRPSGSL